MSEQKIKIPKEMEKEIEKLITERPELGYRSVREFLITACFLQVLRMRGEGVE
jgi:hypothetical protein